ncbi:hypothetical protein R1sor_021806 [Riccia sorocarpa]|uniref:Uncharacterized protein n=1 Tax=Riccia sorocarpa TaxID=122646 RepID=A0ABD3GLD1_9MARC
MLTPKPKSLSAVGNSTQMTQDMSCIRFSFPTDDTSRLRRLSVEILFSRDPDRDEVSSGASEGRSNDELCACSEDEGRLAIVPNTSALTIAEEGFEVQTPFFPGRIQLNARTGMITILPADEQQDVSGQSGPTHLGTLLRYSKFKGKSGDDPDLFLDEYKRIATANREGTEADYLRIFPALPKGRASRWFEVTPPTTRTVWTVG